jgi:glycosyltransferase involved in cell wall biosynthesis
VIYPLPLGSRALSPHAVLPRTCRLLLTVGRLDEGKQIDQLISMFSALADQFPEWRLVIIGEGPLRERLQQDVERLSLVDRVFLPGRIGNLGEWYMRADLFALTSRFEGFPNSLLEAMAHGCAAISYDCDTGPRDIVRHGVDGVLISPVGDMRAFTSALESLMRDPEGRRRMGARAKEVQERYSIDRILRMWDELFASIDVSGPTQ